MPNASHADDPLAHLRVITMAQVCELTTYTPQHVYRMIAAGRFPAPRRFGPNRIVFPLVQFEEWFASRPLAKLDTGEDKDGCNPL